MDHLKSDWCKIYICDHKPQASHTSKFFSTLVSGVFSSSTENFIGDLDGENIALAHGFSEMRHQHHVWKHPGRKAEYVGFEHYRRAFLIDFLPASLIRHDQKRIDQRRRFARDDRDCMVSISDTDFLSYLAQRGEECSSYSTLFRNWLSAFDIILPRPLFDETVKEQWAWTHISQYWDIFVESVNTNPYFLSQENYIDFDLIRPSFFNMYIMKWDYFSDYMRFWTDCATFLATRLPDEPRLLGHFSERIINLFVNQKTIENPALRVLRLPVVYRDI